MGSSWDLLPQHKTQKAATSAGMEKGGLACGMSVQCNQRSEWPQLLEAMG